MSFPFCYNICLSLLSHTCGNQYTYRLSLGLSHNKNRCFTDGRVGDFLIFSFKKVFFLQKNARTLAYVEKKQ